MTRCNPALKQPADSDVPRFLRVSRTNNKAESYVYYPNVVSD